MVHLGIILTTPFTPQGVVEPSPLSRSGFICSVFALRSNLGFALALQWHRSVFTLAIHALCRLHMQCLRAAFELGLRFGFAVASQRLHAGNTRFV